MIDGFTEAQIIGALAAWLVASYVAFFGWLVTSLHGLRREMYALNRDTRLELGGRIDAVEQRLSARIDDVEQRLSTRIDDVEQKLSARIDDVERKLGARIDDVERKLGARIDALDQKFNAVTVAVSRLEGAVYHGLPEPRRAASD